MWARTRAIFRKLLRISSGPPPPPPLHTNFHTTSHTTFYTSFSIKSSWIYVPCSVKFPRLFKSLPSLFRVWILHVFALIFHRFWYGKFIDLHHFNIQTSLRYQTSQTLFLNNTTAFCAQNHVSSLSDKYHFWCVPFLFLIQFVGLIFSE